jgi:hypothetical protein
MTITRLPLRGRNRLFSRFLISLPLFQNPIRVLCQVTSHRAHRLLVPLALADPQVQPTDMSIRAKTMMKANDVRRLDEGPLEVSINVRSKLSIARLTPRANHPRSRPRVGDEPRGTRKPSDVSHLQEDDDRQDESYAWQGLQ